jgi:uncharacterized protein with HEPN domain
MKDDKLFLTHILERITRIRDYTSGGYAVFMDESVVQDAVLRNLEVIGEAVKQISTELRDQNPQIPWRRIAGMRDVLIHDYMGVNLVEVWNVVQHNLDSLERQIQAILAE